MVEKLSECSLNPYTSTADRKKPTPGSGEVHLQLWEECIGVFEKLEIMEYEISVTLVCKGRKLKIILPTDMFESQIKRKLHSCKAGTKIALTKTDEASKPLVVRIIEA